MFEDETRRSADGDETGAVDPIPHDNALDPSRPPRMAFDDLDLPEAIETLGTSIRAAFEHVFGSFSVPPQRPKEVASIFRVNRDISSRLWNALRAPTGLGVVHALPGPDPLRKLVRAAARQSVSPETLGELRRLIDEFERLIRFVGDRHALDAILSASLPDARSRFELASKQLIFRGTSLLKGVMAETWVHGVLIVPARSPDHRCDVLYLYGTLGLRRLRPGVEVKFTGRDFGTPKETPAWAAWEEFEGARPGDELDRFLTRPPAEVQVTRCNDQVIYGLAGNAVGQATAVDKLFLEYHPGAIPHPVGEFAGRNPWMYVAPSIPVKQLVFDVFVHDETLGPCAPTLHIHDTTCEGPVRLGDPIRDPDILPVEETLEILGRPDADLERFAAPEIPNYPDILRHVAGRLGVETQRFTGYRTRIQYPMHGAQVTISLARQT